MKMIYSIAAVVGRLLISAIFLKSAYGKITGFEGSAGYMAAKMPFSKSIIYMLLVGAIFFEAVGGVLVLLGYRARVGALLLFAFLLPTTLIFHNIFLDPSQMNAFMKNAAIMGALLVILANGAGVASFDSSSRNAESE
ncbi:MAG: DoxX family protein [Planctomycetota bacterium]